MVFRVFKVILGNFRVIFHFRIVFVLCDCITFVTKNAKYLCTISQGLGFLGFLGFQGFLGFLGFLQILLFKVEKPPFCTVLRLIVNFRHCASPVKQGFVPNHVNPCVCYFPRVQGFRVQSFQGFMVFRVFQVILGIFRVIFLFRIVFVLCDCITFVTKNAKYLCTISQGLGFLGFQGVFRVLQVILGIFRVIFLFRIVFVLCDCITFVTKNAKYLCTISQGLGFLGFQGFLGFFQGFCRYFCLRWRNHHSVRFSV